MTRLADLVYLAVAVAADQGSQLPEEASGQAQAPHRVGSFQ